MGARNRRLTLRDADSYKHLSGIGFKPGQSGNPGGQPRGGNPNWKPGTSGNPNGRPKGKGIGPARHRLETRYVDDLHDAWLKYGVKALERTAKEHPSIFVRVVAIMIPRKVEQTVATMDLNKLTDQELADIITANGSRPQALPAPPQSDVIDVVPIPADDQVSRE